MTDVWLAGVSVPLLTPYARDGSVDVAAIRSHVDRLIAAGVEGVVALGTTGEFADLTAAERETVVDATLSAVGGRVPVLVGTGAVGTREAVAYARAAERAGADGVLSLPPLYWKLPDDGVFAHYAEIAAGIDLPVVLYDFPALAGTALSPAVVERLAREVPSVVGVKLSGPELRLVHQVLARVKPARPDFAVLVGSAELLLASWLAGSDGTIAALANIEPQVLRSLIDALRGGDLEAARRHHAHVRALAGLTQLASPPILALKLAAAAAGSPIEPLVRTPPPDAEATTTRVCRALAELQVSAR